MPRICMPTWRAFKTAAYYCGVYEFQDVLCTTDDVDLICLEPGPHFDLKRRWQLPLLYRDFTGRLVFTNPGLQRVRLASDYDLFAVVCQSYWDLLFVNAIDGWKDRCKTSVCWINELWPSSVQHYEHCLRALDRFDHVFVGVKKGAQALSVATGRQCHWLPIGVDTLRFCPYPNPPQRVVGAYSVGRRRQGVHESLLRIAMAENFFYVYDTQLEMAQVAVFDPRQHREQMAGIAKRSRYFMVAPAKMNDLSETNGEAEIGNRYYEGAAAGAAMIGEIPRCEHYSDLFGWRDAVIEVNPDGSDVRDVLSQLDSDPMRLLDISRRNAAEALLRHDAVHRWNEIYQVAGLAPSPGMVARERDLAALAYTTMPPAAAQRASTSASRSVLVE